MVNVLRNSGYEVFASWLIQHGANVNKSNKLGNTALHFGAIQGNKEHLSEY